MCCVFSFCKFVPSLRPKQNNKKDLEIKTVSNLHSDPKKCIARFLLGITVISKAVGSMIPSYPSYKNQEEGCLRKTTYPTIVMWSCKGQSREPQPQGVHSSALKYDQLSTRDSAGQ